jgi:DNA repair protein RadC
MTKTQDKLREIKISYKSDKRIYQAKSISDSLGAYNYLKEFYAEEDICCQEQFVILFLNRANKPIGAIPLFKGGLSSTIVDCKLIFATALKSLASAIIISHNHPSGSLTPSTEDKRITQKIKDGCYLLDLSLIDHVILSPDGHYLSFADEGIL